MATPSSTTAAHRRLLLPAVARESGPPHGAQLFTPGSEPTRPARVSRSSLPPYFAPSLLILRGAAFRP